MPVRGPCERTVRSNGTLLLWAPPALPHRLHQHVLIVLLLLLWLRAMSAEQRGAGAIGRSRR